MKLTIVGDSEGADWPIIELRIRTRLELGSFVPVGSEHVHSLMN